MFRSAFFLAATGAAIHAMPQGGVLAGTSLTVDPGTDVRVLGSQTFTVEAGSTVQNNGSITFGAQAIVIEAAGWPIAGSGTEATTRTYTAPLSATDPAGLGMELTTSIAPGVLTIVRGHVPFTDNGGMQSVKRWYDADAAMNTTLDASVSFHYEPVELNGVDENDQTLHVRGVGNVWYWSPSTVNTIDRTVTATGLDSLGTYTLFDGISTGMRGIEEANGTVIHATEDGSMLFVRSTGAGTIRLFDPQGRSILQHATLPGTTHIPIATLASGAYAVLFGSYATRFVKP